MRSTAETEPLLTDDEGDEHDGGANNPTFEDWDDDEDDEDETIIRIIIPTIERDDDNDHDGSLILKLCFMRLFNLTLIIPAVVILWTVNRQLYLTEGRKEEANYRIFWG